MNKKRDNTSKKKAKQKPRQKYQKEEQCMTCGQFVSCSQLSWSDNDELVCPLCMSEENSCGCGDE